MQHRQLVTRLLIVVAGLTLIVVLLVAATPSLLHALAEPYYSFKGADADRLYAAIRRDQADVVRALADGADPNAYRVRCHGVLFSLALAHGPSELGCTPITPLQVALEAGNFAAAQTLIEQGATVAIAAGERVHAPDPQTPLTLASRAQEWTVFHAILAQTSEPPQRICSRLLYRLLGEHLQADTERRDVIVLRPLTQCGAPADAYQILELIAHYEPDQTRNHEDLLRVFEWLSPLPPSIIERANQQVLRYNNRTDGAWLEHHFSFLRRLRPAVGAFGQTELLSSPLQFPNLRVAEWLLAEGADPNGFDTVDVNVHGVPTLLPHTTLAKLARAQCRKPDLACEAAIEWLLPLVDGRVLPSGHYAPVSELLILFIHGSASDPAFAAGKRRILERLIEAGLFDRSSAHLRALADSPQLPNDLAERMHGVLAVRR